MIENNVIKKAIDLYLKKEKYDVLFSEKKRRKYSKSLKREQVKFKLDAIDQFAQHRLSNEKMESEKNKTHPRLINDQNQIAKFSVCCGKGSSTGSLGTKDIMANDFEEEMGVGISLYF